jgi:hypothetical protein
MKIKLHAVLTSELDVGECIASGFGHFVSKERIRYPLDRRLNIAPKRKILPFWNRTPVF